MNSSLQTLLKENIYYSHESMSFYRIFYGGLGNDYTRELPSSLNTYLHGVVNFNEISNTPTHTLACIGRYYDEKEEDERELDYDGYFTNAVKVDMHLAYYSNDNPVIASVSPRLSKAMHMASLAHIAQHRKSDRSPYINHLIQVQYLLVNVAAVKDEDVIIAGVLHDIIEDTDIDVKTLAQNFGSRVAKLVMALTDDKALSLEQRRSITIEKLKSAPESIKLIKLADACSNVEAIPATWNIEKVYGYLEWLDAVVENCKGSSLKLAEYYQDVRNSH